MSRSCLLSWVAGMLSSQRKRMLNAAASVSFQSGCFIDWLSWLSPLSSICFLLLIVVTCIDSELEWVIIDHHQLEPPFFRTLHTTVSLKCLITILANDINIKYHRKRPGPGLNAFFEHGFCQCDKCHWHQLEHWAEIFKMDSFQSQLNNLKKGLKKVITKWLTKPHNRETQDHYY